MKNFNAQYGKHSRLELLKHFILEHGAYIELKRENSSLFRVK